MTLCHRYSGSPERSGLASARAIVTTFMIGTSGLVLYGPAMADPLLEEIVVTAQKREQNLQDVPIAVAAFGGEAVRDLGLSRPKDIAFQIPGVVMKSVNGDNSPIFTVRGIGLTDFTVSNNSAVSLYVDQIVKPYYPMANFSLFDLERVEVLKGPQGTLYGRNNTGGAIKFVTRAPSLEPDAFMRLDYGNYQTFEMEGAVGGKIAEGLAGRLSVFTRQRYKGYQFNNLTNERNGKISKLAGRAAFLWNASDDITVNVMAYAGRNDSDVPLFKLAPPFDAVLGSPNVCAAAARGERARDGSCVDSSGQYDPDPNPHHVQSGNVQGQGVKEDGWGTAATIDWDLGSVNLTSVTGYDTQDRTEYQDFDGSPLILVDNAFFQDMKAFSQELRFASDKSSGLYWILGGFYSNDRLRNHQKIRTDALFGTPGGSINVEWKMKTESYAVFGQLEYPFTDTLEAVLGLRYTHEEKSFDGGTRPELISFLPLVLVQKETSFDDVSGKIGLNFRPANDLLFYASASKGMKSGGFNGAFATNPIVYTPYGKEQLFAYEVGMKSTLSDTLRLNISSYYYDWKDFQATITSIDPVTNLPVQLLTNAGKARTIGLEGDVTWRPVEELRVSFGANLNDGEVKSGQLKGRDLANNPRFSLNSLIRYEIPVSAWNGDAFIQTDFGYRTKYHTRIKTASTRPLVTQEGYWIVNGRIGARMMDGQLEASIWVRNLFDKLYLQEVFDQGTINTLDLYSEPRTYGVGLMYKF